MGTCIEGVVSKYQVRIHCKIAKLISNDLILLRMHEEFVYIHVASMNDLIIMPFYTSAGFGFEV